MRCSAASGRKWGDGDGGCASKGLQLQSLLGVFTPVTGLCCRTGNSHVVLVTRREGMCPALCAPCRAAAAVLLCAARKGGHAARKGGHAAHKGEHAAHKGGHAARDASPLTAGIRAPTSAPSPSSSRGCSPPCCFQGWPALAAGEWG